MRERQVESLDVLEIAAAWSGTQLVLRLSGELDLCSAPQLGRALYEAAEQLPSQLILDLERMRFMDAAGIRCILTAAEIFGPRLILRRTPPYILRLFTITGLEQRLTFELDSGSG